MWKITIGYPAVVQVLLLHQIFGDEPSGLPKDAVPPPSIDPQHTEEFPDLLLSGAVTIHEDDPQEHHEETRLGQRPLITPTIVSPEVELPDEGVDVPLRLTSFISRPKTSSMRSRLYSGSQGSAAYSSC